MPTEHDTIIRNVGGSANFSVNVGFVGNSEGWNNFLIRMLSIVYFRASADPQHLNTDIHILF